MTYVDSTYFLALAKSSDQFHSRAIAWAHAAQPPFVTTEYVVWESINGLSKVGDRPRAHALVDAMGDSSAWQLVSASHDLTTQGLQMHRQHADKEWSLTDCISF